jgi:ATP-dependent protease HslVU (ClpYQ) peptidase subunit
MTCIVGYIDKEYIYMGADSLGSSTYSKSIREDNKLFKKGNMIIGFTTSYRMGQLLRWKLEIPKHPPKMNTEEYMCTLFIDAVIKCFQDNKYILVDKAKIEGGTFLVGYRNKLIKIYDNFQVAIHKNKFNGCGCGDEVASGAMESLLKYDKNIKPERLLLIALETAESQCTGVQRPFKIIKIKRVN